MDALRRLKHFVDTGADEKASLLVGGILRRVRSDSFPVESDRVGVAEGLAALEIWQHHIPSTVEGWGFPKTKGVLWDAILCGWFARCSEDSLGHFIRSKKMLSLRERGTLLGIWRTVASERVPDYVYAKCLKLLAEGDHEADEHDALRMIARTLVHVTPAENLAFLAQLLQIARPIAD